MTLEIEGTDGKGKIKSVPLEQVWERRKLLQNITLKVEFEAHQREAEILQAVDKMHGLDQDDKAKILKTRVMFARF